MDLVLPIAEGAKRKLKIASVVASITSDSCETPAIQVDLTLSDKTPMTTFLSYPGQSICPAMVGKDPTEQDTIDELMTQRLAKICDENRYCSIEKAGRNVIFALSLAVCKAGARIKDKPLYKYIREISENEEYCEYPCPVLKVINSCQLDSENKPAKQHVMIFRTMARSFEDAIIVVKELYMHFKDAIKEDDDGGCNLNNIQTKEALDLLVEVIDNAGYLGAVYIGLDFTASKLDIHESKYMVKDYNILFFKNPFHCNDWDLYDKLTHDVELSHEVTLSFYEDGGGDEIEKARVVMGYHSFTNLKMLRKAIKGKVCNSLLLEVNELRCITECIEVLELLRTAGWTLLMSGHNSCEMDTDIADLFVGFRPYQIEIGDCFMNEHKPCNMCERLKYIDSEGSEEYSEKFKFRL
ncbi:Enolase [Trema orientale]|uniref:phosphopyruvate hydratase n=1 Tax=Trema orientale TaxID=63057 RepID=A0A2P5FLR6_TREOI|nr:Enolase [Trema orientale]